MLLLKSQDFTPPTGASQRGPETHETGSTPDPLTIVRGKTTEIVMLMTEHEPTRSREIRSISRVFNGGGLDDLYHLRKNVRADLMKRSAIS